MATVLGLYGVETNYFHRRDGARLVRTTVRDSQAAEVVVLAPDTIHSVANRGRNYSRAIHVYLGPLTQIAGSVWTADGTGERPFDNAFSFAQARAMAAQAD